MEVGCYLDGDNFRMPYLLNYPACKSRFPGFCSGTGNKKQIWNIHISYVMELRGYVRVLVYIFFLLHRVNPEVHRVSQRIFLLHRGNPEVHRVSQRTKKYTVELRGSVRVLVYFFLLHRGNPEVNRGSQRK